MALIHVDMIAYTAIIILMAGCVKFIFLDAPPAEADESR
jgi:hypothetical protein